MTIALTVDTTTGNLRQINAAETLQADAIDRITSGAGHLTIGATLGASNELQLGSASNVTRVEGDFAVDGGLDQTLDANSQDIIGIDVATNDAEHNMGNQAGASLTLNANNGNFQRLTLTGNITSITMTVPTSGIGRFQFKFIQDGTGSRTVTGWPAAVQWPGGTAPTFSTAASSEDIVSFYYDGTNWYGTFGLNFS